MSPLRCIATLMPNMPSSRKKLPLAKPASAWPSGKWLPAIINSSDSNAPTKGGANPSTQTHNPALIADRKRNHCAKVSLRSPRITMAKTGSPKASSHPTAARKPKLGAVSVEWLSTGAPVTPEPASAHSR